MEFKEKKTQIGWSNYEASLRRFDIFYFKAQNLFAQARANHALLPLLYDTINEVYRCEYPYLNRKSKDGLSQAELLQNKRAKIQIDFNNYLRNSEGYKKNNFGNIFNSLDEFFLELTTAGVETNFLPPVIVPKDIDEKLKAIKQI